MKNIVICTTVIGAILSNVWVVVTCYRAANSDNPGINRKLGKIAMCHAISGCFGAMTIIELFGGRYRAGQLLPPATSISIAQAFAYFFANFAMVVTMR